MNEIDFRNWLSSSDYSKKAQSDIVSRLKRIEREINHCDIDEQYHSDNCQSLLSLFSNMGENDMMKQFPNANLPIGKYYMNTFKHAIRQYIRFKKSF